MAATAPAPSTIEMMVSVSLMLARSSSGRQDTFCGLQKIPQSRRDRSTVGFPLVFPVVGVTNPPGRISTGGFTVRS